MKFLVDTERDGNTEFHAVSNRVMFRKPKTFDPEKQSITDFKYAHVKADGRRVLCVGRLEERKMNVITTEGTDIADQVMQCHWAQLLSKRMNDLEFFDGEIYLPGEGREALSTALANRDTDIHFGVIGHSHTPAGASMEELDRIVQRRNCNLDILEWAQIRGVNRPTNKLIPEYQHEITQESLLSYVQALGPHYDGIVLKNGMYSDWYKFKHKATIDLVVMGIKPAKPGQFEGQCGSLLCGAYIDESHLVEVACVSGMDTSVRATITDSDIGRVVEVTYERVGSRGRLQHPRFFAWRDDKHSCQADCAITQDPTLAEAWADEDND